MIREGKHRLVDRPLRFVRISWRDLVPVVGVVAVVVALGFWVAFKYVRPAPPHTLIVTSGARGSAFYQTAEDYRAILARNGIELKMLESRGAMENLQRLDDPKVRVDIGFVQSGLADEKETEGLVSLGGLYYEPLWVFYRGSQVLDRLSQLRGKRLAVGAPAHVEPRDRSRPCGKFGGIQQPVPVQSGVPPSLWRAPPTGYKANPLALVTPDDSRPPSRLALQAYARFMQVNRQNRQRATRLDP